MSVLISPRAKVNALVGLRGAALKVKVTAPPAEGAANQALVKLLASLLAHPPASISLVAGQRGHRKIVKIEGLDEESLWLRLKPLLPF